MGRESIVDDAERNRQQNEDGSESVQGSDTAATDDEDGTANETEAERERVTQRIPKDILADVSEVQDRYALPSRNAAINFILKQGTTNLLDDGGRS